MLKRNPGKRIVAFVSFLFMISVNALANLIPFNAITTGAVSDFYFNLFAPAGITFGIWGVIYALLFIYGISQLKVNHDLSGRQNLFDDLAIPFTIINGANIAWILAWHYDFMEVTVLLMGIILSMLVLMMFEINRQPLYNWDSFVIAAPFQVYFAWICVASIANVTTLLVSWGFSSGLANPLFGMVDVVWLLIVLVVGLIVMTLSLLTFKATAIGLVFSWAYFGIYLKLSETPLVTGVEWMSPITLHYSVLVMVAYALGWTIFAFYKNRQAQQRLR